MHSTYAQKQKTAQKKEASTAAVVSDFSSNNTRLQRKLDLTDNVIQRTDPPKGDVHANTSFTTATTTATSSTEELAATPPSALANTTGSIPKGPIKLPSFCLTRVNNQALTSVSATQNPFLNPNPGGTSATVPLPLQTPTVEKSTATPPSASANTTGAVPKGPPKGEAPGVSSPRWVPAMPPFAVQPPTSVAFPLPPTGTMAPLSNTHLPSPDDPLLDSIYDDTKKNYLHEEITLLHYSIKNCIEEALNVSNSVKEAFNCPKNIDKIIGKFFSDTSADLSLKQVCEALESRKVNRQKLQYLITKLKPSIFRHTREALEDITFWEHEHHVPVMSISLTSSDLHMRGVGVCTITFLGGQSFVYKPENKSLEKAIYGKNPGTIEKSLAEQFGNINPLSFQIDKSHGSLVEYFDHVDLTKSSSPTFNNTLNTESDESKVRDLVHFSSLLLLRDLHHENLVYSTLDKSPQLIDAEIALWSPKCAKTYYPAQSIPSCEMVRSIATNHATAIEKQQQKRIEEYRKCIAVLESARNLFKGKKSRVVLIETGALYRYRFSAYANVFNGRDYIQKIKDKLNSNIDTYTWLPNEDLLLDQTKKTFLRGEIPFYEWDYDHGIICQKNYPTILLAQSDELLLDNIINLREDAVESYYEVIGSHRPSRPQIPISIATTGFKPLPPFPNKNTLISPSTVPPHQ